MVKMGLICKFSTNGYDKNEKSPAIVTCPEKTLPFPL